MHWQGRIAGAALCVLVTFVGCGDGDEKTDSTAPPSSQSSPSSTSVSTAVEPELRVGTPSIDSKTSPGWPDRVVGGGFLTDVRVGRHDEFDRVVFEFDGDPPDHSVRFVELPVHYDPSDEIADLKGDAALLVVMRGTAYDVTDPERPRDTYGGPNRIEPQGTRAIRELLQTSDYEGLLQWAVGLAARTPFAVAQLRDPSRLVIDIDHSP
jgi:hypothetical protein